MKYPEDYINKIINGDCLEVMKGIPDKSIDLLCTDPPYNQGFSGKGSLAKKYDYRRDAILKISGFYPVEFLNAVKPKLKIFSAFIWTSKDLLPVYINFALENKFNWNILVWVKTNPIPAYNNSLLPDLEYCLFIRETGAYFNNTLNYEDYRKAMIANVANNENGHPTQKHLWMISKMVKIGSKEGDIVLDPFLGSGTTAKACNELKRNWIGIEVNSDYAKIAEDRLKQQVLNF